LGSKADRDQTPADRAKKRFAEALSTHMGVASKPMFGGHGISSDGVMFALVDPDGNCFFRTDALTAVDYEDAAAHPRMPYRRVPDEVIADRQRLGLYAKDALAAAKRAKGATAR
jgi:TfoX/Sxy family transcriptional regulator of competence genes